MESVQCSGRRGVAIIDLVKILIGQLAQRITRAAWRRHGWGRRIAGAAADRGKPNQSNSNAFAMQQVSVSPATKTATNSEIPRTLIESPEIQLYLRGWGAAT